MTVLEDAKREDETRGSGSEARVVNLRRDDRCIVKPIIKRSRGRNRVRYRAAYNLLLMNNI